MASNSALAHFATDPRRKQNIQALLDILSLGNLPTGFVRIELILMSYIRGL